MARVINKIEMLEKFDKLYQKMSTSDNVEHMKLFGHVMREAIEEVCDFQPERAEEMIDKLCAINWHNYMTQREAEAIVSNMAPKAKWSFDQIERTLESENISMSEEPYYNKWALWTEISKLYSDSGKTLMEFLQKVGRASDSELLLLLYGLAIDNLKDKDGVYNIRKYFGLNH